MEGERIYGIELVAITNAVHKHMREREREREREGNIPKLAFQKLLKFRKIIEN